MALKNVAGTTDTVLSEKALIAIGANWHKTEHVTITEDINLVTAFPGLSCEQIEDIEASGKTLDYWSWSDDLGDSPSQYFNFANSAFSGRQPRIAKLKYDAAKATVLKLYFVKVSEVYASGE